MITLTLSTTRIASTNEQHKLLSRWTQHTNLKTYAPTSSYDDHVEKVHQNVEVGMRKHKILFSVVMGKFTVKVGNMNVDETAIDHFRICSSHEKHERSPTCWTCRTDWTVVNIFLKKRGFREWISRNPDGQTRKGNCLYSLWKSGYRLK